MSTLIKSLDIILNTGLCIKTIYVAKAELEKIKGNITELEYYRIKNLLTEIDVDDLPEFYREIPYIKSRIIYSRCRFADYISEIIKSELIKSVKKERK